MSVAAVRVLIEARRKWEKERRSGCHVSVKKVAEHNLICIDTFTNPEYPLIDNKVWRCENCRNIFIEPLFQYEETKAGELERKGYKRTFYIHSKDGGTIYIMEEHHPPSAFAVFPSAGEYVSFLCIICGKHVPPTEISNISPYVQVRKHDEMMEPERLTKEEIGEQKLKLLDDVLGVRGVDLNKYGNLLDYGVPIDDLAYLAKYPHRASFKGEGHCRLILRQLKKRAEDPDWKTYVGTIRVKSDTVRDSGEVYKDMHGKPILDESGKTIPIMVAEVVGEQQKMAKATMDELIDILKNSRVQESVKEVDPITGKEYDAVKSTRMVSDKEIADAVGIPEGRLWWRSLADVYVTRSEKMGHIDAKTILSQLRSNKMYRILGENKFKYAQPLWDEDTSGKPVPIFTHKVTLWGQPTTQMIKADKSFTGREEEIKICEVHVAVTEERMPVDDMMPWAYVGKEERENIRKKVSEEMPEAAEKGINTEFAIRLVKLGQKRYNEQQEEMMRKAETEVEPVALQTRERMLKRQEDVIKEIESKGTVVTDEVRVSLIKSGRITSDKIIDELFEHNRDYLAEIRFEEELEKLKEETIPVLMADPDFPIRDHADNAAKQEAQEFILHKLRIGGLISDRENLATAAVKSEFRGFRLDVEEDDTQLDISASDVQIDTMVTPREILKKLYPEVKIPKDEKDGEKQK